MKRFITLTITLMLILTIFGLAEGVDPVQRYSEDNRLIQEDYIDEGGQRILGPKGFSRREMTYDDGGHVIREAFYNEALELAPNKDGVVVIERRYDESGHVVWYRYLDAEGQPMAVNGVWQVEQGYDDNGNLNHETVLDGEGNPTLHPDGWFEHITVYNEAKQKVSERWLGIDGEPVLLKDSYSGIDRAYDEAGNVIRETYYDASGNVGANAQGIVTVERRYDDQKHVTWYRYLDAEVQPMALNGITEMEQGYDEAGNVNMEIFYDGEGKRTLHPDGWCEHTTVYNDAKQKISERWLGIDGKPVLLKDSHSGIDRAYDEAGNVVRETYYDATGNVGANAQGIVTVERRYDDQKRVVWYRYVDAEDQPMAVNGLVEMEQGYDENGNMNREVVLDGEGKKTLHPDGWCEHISVYNDAKQKVSERWLGIEGEPVLLKGSHSGIDRAYDEAGNVVRETYYDATGNVGANAQGIVTIERQYDDQKRVIRYRYLDASDQPIQLNNVYGMEQGYDEAGNVNLEILYDGEGKRTLHPDGWCEHTTVYNEAKQKVSERWLGIDGEPVLLKGSHSGIDRAYDEAGNVVRETYYDATGNVGANAQGIVTVERRYDDQKRVTWYRYLNAENQPMTVNGMVEMEQGYDENGNLNREVVLDGEGNRTLHSDGWCEHTTVYDEAKQKVSERWLGIDGESVLLKGSHSGIDRAYDEAGNVVRETYYDAAGNVGANAQGIVIVERHYDEDKHVTWYRYVDAGNQPMAVNGVAEMEQDYDENGNLNREVVLDGEGKKTLHPDGWCEHITVYNEAKQKVSERWLGVDGAPVPFKDDYSGIDREFDAYGNTVRETYYDASGSIGANKAGIITILRRFDDQKHLLWYAYQDANGQPMAVNGVWQMEMTYDEAGNLTREAAMDGAGDPALHPDGWHVHDLQYDVAGNKAAERYTGLDGEPVLNKGDYSGIDWIYDESGNPVRETYYDATGAVGPNRSGIIIVERNYNEQGQVTGIRYLDAQESAMLVAGVYGMSVNYDSAGNVSSETVLDQDGNPTLHPDGWCIHRIMTNEAKQKIGERYYDVDGKPALFKGDYSGIDRHYDKHGRVDMETYHDASGDVGPNREGKVIVKTVYNKNGQIVEMRFFDAGSNPMAPESVGACIERRDYDEAGNVCGIHYFDGQNRPMRAKGGWATAEYVFDAQKRKISEAYFDESGSLCKIEGGYARITREYDEAGNVVNETYYDETGKPADNDRGVTTVNREFNGGKVAVYEAYRNAAGEICVNNGVGFAAVSRYVGDDGRVLRESYFDADGMAMINDKKGCAAILYEYDDLGRVISQAYYDTDGSPMEVRGVHRLVKSYDAAGNAQLEQQYDLQGGLVKGNQGYAAAVRRFDGEKRVTEESYYSEDGQRTYCKDGYAMALMTYGEGKKPIAIRYYDTDGAPATMALGYQQVVYAYDEKDNVLSESYYDPEGMRVPCSKGYATVTYRYDANGKVEETAYYDAASHLTPVRDGYARWVTKRDDKGNVVLETYFDENNQPFIFKNGYAGIAKTYDEKNRVLTQTYLGGDGNTVIVKNTRYATVAYEYDDQGRKIRESYYNEEGQLFVPNWIGAVASKTWEFDEKNRVVLEQTWDAEGNLKNNGQDYATLRYWYSDDGAQEVLSYEDKSGNLLNGATHLGYAKLRKTYDSRHLLIREEYLNGKDEPMHNRSYVFGRVLEYDDLGRLVREYTYGKDGKPSSGRGQSSITEYTYDEFGNRSAAYYSSSGVRVR